MYKDKKILAIIPARGGSKGLPRKNIKLLNGKPLIAWTIEAAKKSKFLDLVFVSTDDTEIAETSKKHGASVPFLRPDELAQDSSPVSDAIIHVIDTLEKQGNKFDYVALLEATSPLRRDEEIDLAISTLVDSNESETLVSLGEVHTEHPMIVKKINNQFVTPYLEKTKSIYQRQQADNAYFPYGVIYLSSVDSYRKNKTFYMENTLPLFIERWQNYEIDDIYDFYCVENILKHKSE